MLQSDKPPEKSGKFFLFFFSHTLSVSLVFSLPLYKSRNGHFLLSVLRLEFEKKSLLEIIASIVEKISSFFLNDGNEC